MARRTFEIHSGQSPEDLRITIKDEESRTIVAHLKLDPTELWQLLRGGILRLEGECSDHLDRVGKTLVRTQVEVPGHALKGIEYIDRKSAGEEWARTAHPGWEEYSGYASRTGIQINLGKWV